MPLRRSVLLVFALFLGSLSLGRGSGDVHPHGALHPDLPLEVCPCPPAPPPRIEVPPPHLAMKVCVPVCANENEELEYRILIENRSPTAAHHVVIHDPLPANARFVRARPDVSTKEPELQWHLGTIEGCGRREICLTLAPTTPGDVKNCVRVTYEHGVCVCTRVGPRPTPEPEQVPVPPRVGEEIDRPPRPSVGNLTLTKSGPKRAYASGLVIYQLTVANQGASPAPNVTIIDPLPAKTVFVSASDGGRFDPATASTRAVRWLLGTLAPGQSRTVELRIRGAFVGELRNQCEVSADGGVRATAEARTELLGAAGLLMLVVDTKDPIEVGQETQYEIIVRAQGTAAVNNIRITAHVPPELAVIRVQGPVDHLKDGQKVVYQPLNLPAGSDTIYRITVKGVKSGDLRFRVEMTADPLTAGPLLEEESTNVFEPGNGR